MWLFQQPVTQRALGPVAQAAEIPARRIMDDEDGDFKATKGVEYHRKVWGER